MSEQVETKKVKKADPHKWTRLQALGFWFLLTAVTMFWSGVYLGGMASENSHNTIERAKAEAIESVSKQ